MRSAIQKKCILYPYKSTSSLNGYKYSSFAVGNETTRKCPFLSKQNKTTLSMNVCPIINRPKAIYKQNKMLYSSKISEHSL